MQDAVQWMLVHISQYSVGHAKVSVGHVTHDMWYANQMCNIPQEAAESVRVLEATTVHMQKKGTACRIACVSGACDCCCGWLNIG